MQLAWLADFIALAETNNFTRAAAVRHITRPAFGRRIRALEIWCGVSLIDRGGYPVELTEEGRAFLEIARNVVKAVSDFRERATDAERAKSRDLLRIATGRTIARTRLPEWISRLRRLSPALEVRVTTLSLHDGVIMLAEGSADVLITYSHPRLLLNLDPTIVEYCVVALETMVPLSATKDGLPIFRLPGTAATPIPHIKFQPTLALAKIEREALKLYKKPIHLTSAIEIDSPEAALDFCIAGMGVAWLPLSLAKRALESGVVAYAAPQEALLQFEIRAYRLRGELSPMLAQFWEQMQLLAAQIGRAESREESGRVAHR